MRLIIAGSRDAQVSPATVARAVASLRLTVTRVISGGCRGPDEVGAAWARRCGIQVIVFPADWRLHGKAAGPYRNRLMAQHADALLAFWDGESRGTANMIAEMRALGKPVYVMGDQP